SPKLNNVISLTRYGRFLRTDSRLQTKSRREELKGINSFCQPLASRQWLAFSFPDCCSLWFVSVSRACLLLLGICRPWYLAFRLMVYSPAVFLIAPEGW